MRTVVAGIGAAVLAIALAIVGYETASAMMEWKLSHLFGELPPRLVLTGPDDLLTLRVRFAVAFAWPAVVVGLTVLLYRLRAGADPSWRRVAIYALVAFAAFALFVIVPVLAMEPFDTRGGLQPMILVTDLAPGAGELRMGMAVLLGFAGFTWLNTRRAPRA